MSRSVRAVAMIGVLLAMVAWPTAAQEPCRFVLGFAALRDSVGVQKVGDCLEDEHFNDENGNAEQRTKGGLLVWRKVDNFTAFTDGGMTWIAGPNGMQSRPNSERFSWERDPVQAPPAAPSITPPAATAPAAAPAATPRAAGTATPAPPAAACHPSYPDFCIPPGPPEVNCNSPVVAGRKSFTVRQPDPHRLDRDGNGRGCES